MTDPIPVVAAVLTGADGRVLLARRGPRGPHRGLWEFPGGKVEPGESPEAALARELQEEMGIEVAVGEHLLTVDWTYSHACVRLSAYRCILVAGEPRPLDCAEVAWVEPGRLGKYPMPAADEPVRRLVQATAPAPKLE